MYQAQTDTRCNEPVRQVEISRELDALGKAVVNLREVISELSKRISPILANTPTACSPEKAQVNGNNTVIGKVIREQITTLEELRNGVVEMISKVEV